MKVVMLALAESMGHEPIWALQGGCDERIIKPLIEYFLKVNSMVCSNNPEEVTQGETLFSSWCEVAEDLASNVDEFVWSASDVFFFGIPEDCTPLFGRDGIGNEVSYYVENGEIKFAKYIPAEEVYKHTW